MLGHCINERCDRPLHSFAEGRLFQFDVISTSVTASEASVAQFDEKPHKQTFQFWLCGSCASAFKLVLESLHGIKLISHEERAAQQQDLMTTSSSSGAQVKAC